MKKLVFAMLTIATFGFSSLSADPVWNLDPYAAYDLNYNGTEATAYERVYSGYITNHDFNDYVQSQIVVWGIPTGSNPYPQVKIGSSIGAYVGKQAITDNSIVVGYLMAYNHITVNQGYLESTYNSVYDATGYIR